MNRWLLILGLVLLVGLSTWQWSRSATGNENVSQPKNIEPPSSSLEKITGLSFVGSPREVQETSINSVLAVNARWLSLMPYSFSRAESNKLGFDSPRQWWGERTEGVQACIRIAQDRGLKIMLKPHLWIIHGGFTGTFGFEKEEDWANWEKDYEIYILHYARMADSLNVDMFCIGTELERFVKNRPEFWKSLIQKVKSIYDGPLTYAANWDAYTRFPFWDELDYVGIDAYFPLSDQKTPSVKDLIIAWDNAHKELEIFSKKYQKPILFTEYGYQSVDYTTKEPWQVDQESPINEEAQSRALEALYKKFFAEEWFAGGFLWKWFDQQHLERWSRERGYTPQGKPSEEIVKKWYKNYQ